MKNRIAKSNDARITNPPLLEGDGGRLQASNPLLQAFSGIHQTAPFTSIKIEHYLPAFDAAIEEAKKEVQEIIDSPEVPDFANTIVALDLAG